jgi:dUTPase
MVCDSGKSFSTGYYMYPRSSLSKTKLRLANSVGIIDSGYCGFLIGMFDIFYDINVINRVYSIIKNQRLGEDIRILDSNNKIIDPSEIFNKVKRNKHFGLKIKK